MADELVGPVVGADPVEGAVLLDDPRGPGRRRGETVGGGEGGGAVTEDHPRLLRGAQPEGNGLGEQAAHADNLLARVLHARQDDDAEGPALGEDLGQQPGRFPLRVCVGVGGEGGELVDDEDVQRVPGSRGVQA
ncbi:hypothetical protein [Intrasporangium calvum]|uniref:hypothetical protein n=1 Tax=Intrasporangium calvum TaxID=53358 RepID=UPI000DF5C842|nr:hypothetical protein [Intrasporangium calvum]AXG12042.1 hypothetical protein DN585_00005 [Intrasporangium calvum]